MKRPVREPERWSDRVHSALGPQRWGAPVEDELGALFRRVQEATSPEPPAAPAAPRTRGVRRGHLVWRLAVALVVLVATGGVVSAARLVWRSIASARLEAQTLTVPSGSTAVLSGRSRRKLTVVGPAHLDVAADRVDVALEGGALTAAAGAEPLLVHSAGLLVTVPPGGIGRIAGARGAAPSVDALAGDLRIARETGGGEVALAVAHRWQDERSFPLSESPPPARSEAPALASTPALPSTPALRVEPIEMGRAPRRPGRAPAGETRLLAQAFQALRADKDAESALRALDEWTRRFRTALLLTRRGWRASRHCWRSGRTADALPLLLEMRDNGSGLTRDIQIVRAELLSERDRCAEAMPDFDELLKGGLHDTPPTSAPATAVRRATCAPACYRAGAPGSRPLPEDLSRRALRRRRPPCRRRPRAACPAAVTFSVVPTWEREVRRREDLFLTGPSCSSVVSAASRRR